MVLDPEKHILCAPPPVKNVQNNTEYISRLVVESGGIESFGPRDGYAECAGYVARNRPSVLKSLCDGTSLLVSAITVAIFSDLSPDF